MSEATLLQILQKLDGLSNEMQSMKSEMRSMKSEQQRHGDLIHQLISNVGALGIKMDQLEQKVDQIEHKVDHLEQKMDHLEQKVDKQFESTFEKFNALQRDIEITYHESAHNKLDIQRLKRTIELFI